METVHSVPERSADNFHPMQTRRLIMLGVLFILMSLAGLYVIYDRLAERSFTLEPRLFSWQLLAACTGLLLVYFVSDGLRLYYTLRALGHRMPGRAILKLIFINLFFSNVTPMATGGGFAQVIYMRSHGIPVGTAMAATAVRTMLAVFFIFSATPAFFLTLNAFDGGAFSRQQVLVLVLCMALYLGFFAIVIFRTRWLIVPLVGGLSRLQRMHLLSERRHRRWCYACKREMLRFAGGFGQFLRGNPIHMFLALIFTFGFLLSLFTFPFILLRGLGYTVEYLDCVGLLTVTTFIMYFAPTPGASGIAEGVFGHFFARLVSPDHLLLVTVAWRFLTIYLGMLIGLVITQRELVRRVNHHAQR